MNNRDHKGNTEEEIYDMFFNWLDEQHEVPQLFPEAPTIYYSDLVCYFYNEELDQQYGDLMFDLWKEKVYNTSKW